jgi:Ca-activated chloride channel homolog
MPNQEAVDKLGLPMRQLPLDYIEIESRVIGLQAEVAIHQLFGNTLDQPLEVVYVFPLVDEASVLEVEMQIGHRTIKSELKDQGRARTEYEDARDAGHHAVLLEQNRPNIFTMNLAGIEPGEEIRVTTRYMAPVPWNGTSARLRFPMVVAPRFIPGTPIDGPSQADGHSPDTDLVPDASKITPPLAEDVSYRVDLNLRLEPGFEAMIESPSHPEEIHNIELAKDGTSRIVLENLTPDRDITIIYETMESTPGVGVYHNTFSANDETEHFMLVQVTPGNHNRPTNPLDVVLVLDDSASMRGAKVEGLKRIAEKLIDRVGEFTRPVRIGVVRFGESGWEAILCPISPVGTAQMDAIRSITGNSGGTMLGRGISLAMTMFGNVEIEPGVEYERCVVALSDGQSHDRRFKSRDGVRLHTVGIDAATNDSTLKEFAKQTGGQCEIVYPGEDYTRVANLMSGLISGPVVRNVSFKGLPADAVITKVGDVFAYRPMVVAIRSSEPFGDFTIMGRGTDGSLIKWDVPAQNIQAERGETSLATWIWAKEQISGTENKSTQTKLSLRYGIIGPTTSFVAVSEKRIPGEEPEKITIPVMLPDTWQYDGIGDIMAKSTLLGATRRFAGPPRSYGLLGGSSRDLGFRSFSGGGGYDDGIRHLSAPARRGGSLESFGLMDDDSDDDMLFGTNLSDPVEDYPDLLEELQTLLTNIQETVGWSGGTETFSATFRENLEKENFNGWSELNLASFFESLLELNKQLATPVAIPDAIKRKPKDVDAFNAWQRAMTALGESTD